MALVIAYLKLVSGRILASCILKKVAPKFGGQALFSRFTLNTQNTLSSTEPTITTIDAIGARDIAFESKNDMLPVCYGHIWLIRKSLMTKKKMESLSFFFNFTHKRKKGYFVKCT